MKLKYKVFVTYQRNCSHIIPTKEQRDTDDPLPTLTQEEGEAVRDGVLQQGQRSGSDNILQQGQMSGSDSTVQQGDNALQQGKPSEPAPAPCQSDRTRRLDKCHIWRYIPSVLCSFVTNIATVSRTQWIQPSTPMCEECAMDIISLHIDTRITSLLPLKTRWSCTISSSLKS